MDKVFRQRRQLLLYLGLGALGAGTTIAFRVGTQQTNPTAK
jgi:hypothetical protein